MTIDSTKKLNGKFKTSTEEPIPKTDKNPNAGHDHEKRDYTCTGEYASFN